MLSTTTSSGVVMAAPQVLQWVEEGGHDYLQVADKAAELGLNNEVGKKFLAQVFKTDRATVERYFKNSAPSQGTAPQVEDTENVAPVSHPLNLTPRQAKQVFAAVHGAGNPKISNAEIQGWLARPRAPRDIVQAMAEHHLSAAQVGRAMGWNAAQVQDVLSEYGLDVQTLAQKEVEGWSAQDLNQAVATLPEREDSVTAHQQVLETQVRRIELLLQQARSAQTQAAHLQGEYVALNAKFEPAFAEYNALSQEQAALQTYIAHEQLQQAQGQHTLAHLDQIEERRMRRATASKEAQYQIDNAAQSISNAQTRLAAIQARMSALETWGRPLMEQTQAAQARAQQTQQTADEKNSIAVAQGDMARRAADEYQAAVTALSADQGRLVMYLQAHPQLESTGAVQTLLRHSIETLDRTLNAQRAWTDAARTQGAQLDAQAQQWEAEAETLRVALDPLQPARLQAEARIQSAQAQFDTTQRAQAQAQADLDAAYQQRTKADYQSGKGGRNRARDEAQRLIDFRTQQLTQATQQRQAAADALDQVHTQGDTPRLVALEAQGQWQGAATVAADARAQAWAQSQLGHALLDIEQATQSALARSLMYGMGLSQVKVEAARTSAVPKNPQQLRALEKELQADLGRSIEVLERVEQSAVNDRYSAQQEQQHLIPLQAQALGQQQLAQSLALDAAHVQKVVQGLELPQWQENVQAAAQRLKDAQWAEENADMHLDWAQARVNAKKQGKAIAVAQPALQTAQNERMQAQQAYDVAQAQLRSAQHLDAAVNGVARESGYTALSAMQAAQTATLQAQTQAQWAQDAQARYAASDAVLATAQVALLQSIQALADAQALRAEQSNSDVAQSLRAQSAAGQAWAQHYADVVADRRAAQIETDFEQAKLDQLEIQSGAMQVFSQLLNGKVQQLTRRYEAAQASLPGLQHAFQSASAQAQTDRAAAEQAYARMNGAEKKAEIEFVAARHKLQGLEITPQRLQSEEEKALSRRKSTQKKLHWFDDKAQFVDAHSEVQAARQQATAALQTVQHSSQAALDAGEVLQAQTAAALLRAGALRNSHEERAQAVQRAAELSTHAHTQAAALARATRSEDEAAQQMLAVLEQHVDAQAAPAYAALLRNTQVSHSVAQARATQAQAHVQQIQQVAATQKHAAAVAQSQRDSAAGSIQNSMAALQTAAIDQAQASAHAGETEFLARQAQRGMSARADYNAELHEQRVRADQVEKARKKKSWFATLVHMGALIASAAAAIVAPPLGASLGAHVLSAAAAGAGINAAAQGINLAAGFQDEWDTKSMVAMGGVGVFGAVMGTVTQTMGRLMRGTVFGNAVPGSAAVRTLVSSADPLLSPVAMSVVTTQPAVSAIAAGPLSWVGTAASWAAGATVGSIAQQAFEMAAGVRDKLDWNAVKKITLQQALGGVLRVHFASSWAGSPFAPTLYRPLSLSDMAIDVGKRVMGTLFIDTVLNSAGLIDRIDGGRLLAVGVSRGVQVLLRDAMGTVLTPHHAASGDFVASTVGQSLIRSATYLSQASVSALLGKEIDWNSTLYLGIGRAAGQLGSAWGEAKAQELIQGVKSLVQ